MSSPQRRFADPSDPRSDAVIAPDDSLREQIHDALGEHVQCVSRGHVVEETNMRQKLRDVCAEARRQGVRIEHLIIALKENWHSLTERDEIARGTLDRDLRSEVVTVVVDEYFRDA